MKNKTAKRGKNFREAFAILTKLDRFSSVNQSIGTINTVYSFEFIESFMKDLSLITKYIANQDTKMQLLQDIEVRNIITRLKSMRDSLTGSPLHTKMCKKLDIFLDAMPLPQVTTNYDTHTSRRKLIYTNTPTRSSTVNHMNLSYPTPEGGLSRAKLHTIYNITDDEKYCDRIPSNTFQIVQESEETCRPINLSYPLMLNNTRHQQGAQQTHSLQREEYDRQDRRLTSLENQNSELLQKVDRLTVKREEYDKQDFRLTSLENQNRDLLQTVDRLIVSVNESNRQNKDLLQRVDRLTVDMNTSNQNISQLQKDMEFLKSYQNQESKHAIEEIYDKMNKLKESSRLIPEFMLRPLSPLPFSPASSLNSTPTRGYNSPSLRAHTPQAPTPKPLSSHISGVRLTEKLQAAHASLS